MEYTDEFEEFWIKFPARWNAELHGYVKRKKKPAFLKWKKLKPEIRQECLTKVHLIKQYEGSASSVRDCVTWLNQAGWDDIPNEKIKPFVTKKQAESMFQDIHDAKIDVNAERNRQRKGLGIR